MNAHICKTNQLSPKNIIINADVERKRIETDRERETQKYRRWSVPPNILPHCSRMVVFDMFACYTFDNFFAMLWWYFVLDETRR